MGKILVGYDGSEGAKKAVDRAKSMTKEGDSIVVVFVIPESKVKEFEGFDTGLTMDKARDMLDGVIAEIGEEGLQATGVIREGDVAEEIMDLGTELECDLIVVGSTGLSKVGPFALGNVAETVARKSSRPVLLVK